MNKRIELTEIDDEQRTNIEYIRLAFSGLFDLIDNYCETSRETSLGLTKLEEAYFWLIKGISKEKSENNE